MSNSLRYPATQPLESQDTPQSWLHAPRRRRVSARRLLPQSLWFLLTHLLRFGCALRLATRSAVGHMAVLLSKKQWAVDLGGSRRRPNGFAVPDERTIFRSRCIQELNSRYPWANMVERTLFLEGFDKGEEFAYRMGKEESGTYGTPEGDM